MFAFETILFELARLFLWPVTLGVLLSFVYALYSLGAFGVEFVQRRRQPTRALVLHSHGNDQDQMELVLLKDLEGVRLCSRVAPMLGLIATMIPMGPALVAVASGESQVVAQSLAPSFAAVIVALASASITFVVHTVRHRWLITPQELPVGVLTAVLGGGYLLCLMHRKVGPGGRGAGL